MIEKINLTETKENDLEIVFSVRMKRLDEKRVLFDILKKELSIVDEASLVLFLKRTLLEEGNLKRLNLQSLGEIPDGF